MAWLTGWKRRKSKTISGSIAGTQTDYQMMLTIHKSTGSDTTTDIYLGTNVRDDFGDVRFTSSDGSTVLTYWIESFTSGSIATIWIKIPLILADPSTSTIYIYYDNTSATSLSNGDNAFIFYDHFEGSSLDPTKWTSGPFSPKYGDGNVTVSNSIATLSGGYNTWWGMFANGAVFATPPFSIEFLYKSSVGTIVGVETTGTINPGPKDAAAFNFAAAGYMSCNNNTCNDEAAGLSPFSSYTLLRADIYAGGIKYYINRSLAYTKTTNIPDEGMKAFMTAAQEANSTYTDWVFIRKYASPEPVFSTTGGEEIFQLFDTFLIAGD